MIPCQTAGCSRMATEQPMETGKLLQCTKCKTEKIETDFHRHKKRSSGRDSRCRECVARYIRECILTNPRKSLLRIFIGMRNRCYNKGLVCFKHYGGRGITICDEWIKSPDCFIDFALAKGWKRGLEVDRINTDGNYEPGNVRFVTRTMNMRNCRPVAGKSSKYRGVNRTKTVKNPWAARIRINGMRLFLGRFVTEEEAAHAYDAEAKRHEGFRLNFPE